MRPYSNLHDDILKLFLAGCQWKIGEVCERFPRATRVAVDSQIKRLFQSGKIARIEYGIYEIYKESTDKVKAKQGSLDWMRSTIKGYDKWLTSHYNLNKRGLM